MIEYLLINFDFQRKNLSNIWTLQDHVQFLLIDYGQASLVKNVCLQASAFSPRGGE